jgi:glycine dehydrogenase
MANELATESTPASLDRSDTFTRRHIGPREAEIEEMLRFLGYDSLDSLVRATIPESILLRRPLALGPPRTEPEVLAEMRRLADRNQVYRSYLGAGYSDCYTPPVIQRNILENPGWYTPYTPYQAEISQGRLEALLNFQTMVSELTGLPLANASLLDEGTAAAEAMSMCRAASKTKTDRFFVSRGCHPQTREVVLTRAKPLGIEIVIGDPGELRLGDDTYFGILLPYPATDGRVLDHAALIERAHAAGVLVVMATDPLALTLLRPPGELGADIAVGSAQRFGVPMGFGGPHAAFLATGEPFKRLIPGRIVGVSKDTAGKKAYRLALQTREQHIRREKATSNICTAQVLLAIMAGVYAMYHGPDGLRRIGKRVHRMTSALAEGLRRLGYELGTDPFFDTLAVPAGRSRLPRILAAAEKRRMNLRPYTEETICVALDETTTVTDLQDLLEVFALDGKTPATAAELLSAVGEPDFPPALARKTPVLTHEIFERYHSEHEMLRYLHQLQSRDLSLTTSMIPLGSCTMKLNGAAEMFPLSWPQFARLHPFAPGEQWPGYQELFDQLAAWLGEITGLPAVSLQPNAGAQGEYTSLLLIRAYHEHRGQGHRKVCLIPDSAHGTNPASAVMAGCRVVPVRCDRNGNIDVEDLKAKADEHGSELAALMITYPSTHGVFEESVREVCNIVHDHGGQVFMDGANMNAQVGLCRPIDIGADVCHLNLHKTFCIPHGGGGPGMGPICAAGHLAPYLPGHPVTGSRGSEAIGPVSAAPYGSASILTISWMYIALMGAEGLVRASQVAILNANYMAKKLKEHYPVLYKGKNGRVAHEFILDLRPFKHSADVGVDDVAKRLMDFGFHAPTMSFPVVGTLMVEPTESESKAELDRFCEAMLTIRREIEDVEEGRVDRVNNAIRNAPHTVEAVSATAWDRPYPREQAAFPLPWLRLHKFWPPVGRIDNAYGDRNLVCTCPPMEAYDE